MGKSAYQRKRCAIALATCHWQSFAQIQAAAGVRTCRLLAIAWLMCCCYHHIIRANLRTERCQGHLIALQVKLGSYLITNERDGTRLWRPRNTVAAWECFRMSAFGRAL